MNKENEIQLDHEAIRKCLKQRGIRNSKIAKRLNRSAGTVSKALKGTPGYRPTLERIHRYYFKNAAA